MLKAWLIAWLLGIAGLCLTPLAWVLPSAGFGHEAPLVGRQAWVWWDLPWGPSGQSSAVVQGADDGHLRLVLLTPAQMAVGPKGNRLVAVTDGTASGVLEAAGLSSEHADPTQYPRARVCVL